jgi:undecaprenyl-diphosphatase
MSVTVGRAPRWLSPGQALALGALQGPTELLPVSSSAHTTLIPWLAAWPYAEADAELRKSFEVALHAGSALALALALRGELTETAASLGRHRIAFAALSLLPPAIVGFALEGFVERRLGGPRSIAAGLLLGALAMALADEPRWKDEAQRSREQAGARDGLALGLAQTAALMPGVSRNGATRAVARARRFGRDDAATLSWATGLPVLFGASALRGYRLARHGAPAGSATALAVGGTGALLSTLAGVRLLRRTRRGSRPLARYCVYRCLLAALVIRRLRDGSTANVAPGDR